MKLLSYNIQACIGSRHYGDYLFGIRRQFEHDSYKQRILTSIAEYISGFDVVCIQELDLGGRRSGFESQLEAIREISGHSHAACQNNRKVGKVSSHGNGILSHLPIEELEDHKLPGLVAGRGLMICRCNGFTIANTHLSVGVPAQRTQLNYIRGAIADKPNVVLMGDFNCAARSPQMKHFAKVADLSILTGASSRTYPSWKPARDIDHVLVSNSIGVGRIAVPEIRFSDHRPVELML